MNSAARTLQHYFADPRHAVSRRYGGWALLVALLAALVWVAWAQGGAHLDTPMGQALAGSAAAALATALGALPALFIPCCFTLRISPPPGRSTPTCRDGACLR